MDIQVSAPGRRRAGWWAVGGVSLGIVALFLYAFVGTFVSGLFVYYAARPLHRRLERRLTKTLAATTTVLVLVLPGLLVLGYAAVVAFRELAAVAGPEVTRAILTRLALDSGTFSDLLRDPVAFLVQFERLGQLQENLLVTLRQFGVVVRGVVHLTLALAFAFFLYRDGSRLEGWFANEIGGKGTSVYAFVEAIDRDLEAVYFGNLLTVLIVTGFAVLVYNGFNAAVPPALRLPVPTLLALLTGQRRSFPSSSANSSTSRRRAISSGRRSGRGPATSAFRPRFSAHRSSSSTSSRSRSSDRTSRGGRSTWDWSSSRTSSERRCSAGTACSTARCWPSSSSSSRTSPSRNSSAATT
ncbi:AI-2E family transporter [Haloplanus sp. GCM10025708]|uniref:AI-2E family transporter n=1 Tax=Haloplanus sp. GCM10025708 TaxID=3252679 RepID=UPI0036141471